jgi:hypothetical protein
MGKSSLFSLWAVGLLLLPGAAQPRDFDAATVWAGRGSLVHVSVEVDGQTAPLYPSPDGSSRRYLEARRGSAYALRIENRTAERLGVVVDVDGLNVISGLEDSHAQAPRSPGRMYVLDPWGETVVRGWRTSLEEVRRFTFVEEGESYAARSGKVSSKMGWIEVAVFREQRPYVARWPFQPRVRKDAPGGEAAAPEAAGAAEGSKRAEGRARALADGYPGTGWGSASDDRAQVVSFDPCPVAAESITLRYEYAAALRTLGILPRPDLGRERLRERERGEWGEWGFAAPPAW